MSNKPALSPEARELLSKLLAQEVDAQVHEGRGGEPLPEAWIELYALTLTAY